MESEKGKKVVDKSFGPLYTGCELQRERVSVNKDRQNAGGQCWKGGEKGQIIAARDAGISNGTTNNKRRERR
jgi:hypothetical protein